MFVENYKRTVEEGDGGWDPLNEGKRGAKERPNVREEEVRSRRGVKEGKCLLDQREDRD
jgi:hypothetical protein